MLKAAIETKVLGRKADPVRDALAATDRGDYGPDGVRLILTAGDVVRHRLATTDTEHAAIDAVTMDGWLERPGARAVMAAIERRAENGEDREILTRARLFRTYTTTAVPQPETDPAHEARVMEARTALDAATRIMDTRFDAMVAARSTARRVNPRDEAQVRAARQAIADSEEGYLDARDTAERAQRRLAALELEWNNRRRAFQEARSITAPKDQ
jgi:hypothetical protein